MTSTLEQYGTGSGIPFGAGIGATAATLSGVGEQFAVVTGFGVMGGLVVGGFAGRFTAEHLDRPNWERRVVAFTLLVSLFVGGLLGALTGWMVDGPILPGFLVGAGTGGVFSFLLSGTLVATARKEQSPDARTP
ncbi:hypothetical protein [Halorientalis halophila]|uniref:hypothetical protein n=1 Tax=Halorientalis halophila TaxID=3108499 RepID=UPI00300B5B70